MMQGQASRQGKAMRGGAVLGIVVLVVLVIAAFMCFVTVPPGHSGVVVTLGRVSDHVLSDGLHFKLPWQNVVLIDNRAQKRQLTTQAFSSDIQQVDIICSINFTIDRATSQNLYKNVGVGYYETVMLPRILENLKAVFSKYTAENLVAARDVLSIQVMEILAPEMRAYGIDVRSVAIENIDFTDAFTDAVEAKQVAEQTKLKTQIQQDEQLVIEKTTAERLVIAAEAEAEVARINADARAYAIRAQAEAEAEANRMVAQSITAQLIQYVQANGWDGRLPQFISGESGMLPVISLEAGE